MAHQSNHPEQSAAELTRDGQAWLNAAEQAYFADRPEQATAAATIALAHYAAATHALREES